MRGLKGKHVLVTGGASGIGRAAAARFLEEGCAVCILDRMGSVDVLINNACHLACDNGPQVLTQNGPRLCG